MAQQTTGRKQGGIANLTNAGKGRKKGVPNKTTKLAKEAIAEAFDRLGGADRLVEWAKEDPDNEKVFFTMLLPKLIPVQTEISGRDGQPIETRQVDNDADAFRRRLLSGVIAGTAGEAASSTVQ